MLVNGAAVASCDTPMWAVEGKSVTTVEGLGTPESPHPLQRALIEEQATQCGYCTSGVLISAAALGRVRTGIAVRTGEMLPPIADRDSLRDSLMQASGIYFPDPLLATAGIHFINLETAVEMAGHAERLVPQRFREICAKYRAVGHKSPRSLRHKAFHLPPLVNCGF